MIPWTAESFALMIRGITQICSVYAHAVDPSDVPPISIKKGAGMRALIYSSWEYEANHDANGRYSP
jgi:hypothetical protein